MKAAHMATPIMKASESEKLKSTTDTTDESSTAAAEKHITIVSACFITNETLKPTSALVQSTAHGIIESMPLVNDLFMCCASNKAIGTLISTPQKYSCMFLNISGASGFSFLIRYSLNTLENADMQLFNSMIDPPMSTVSIAMSLHQ